MDGEAPGGVAAAGGVALALLAGLVLRLCADDLFVQAVIEGALHTADGHPLVYVLTWRQRQLIPCITDGIGRVWLMRLLNDSETTAYLLVKGM